MSKMGIIKKVTTKMVHPPAAKKQPQQERTSATLTGIANTSQELNPRKLKENAMEVRQYKTTPATLRRRQNLPYLDYDVKA